MYRLQSQGRATPHGRLALVDDKGVIVGELSGDIELTEDASLGKGGASNPEEPVVVSFPDPELDGKARATVSPLSHIYSEYGQSGSRLIGGAEWISRGILIGSETLSAKLHGAARGFIGSRPPTATPMVFTDKANRRADVAQNVTRSTVLFTGKVAAGVGRIASNAGDRLGKATQSKNKDGTDAPPGAIKQGVSSGLAAMGTIKTALESGGKHLLTTAVS